MKTKTKTRVAKKKATNQANKTRIMEMVGLSEYDYFWQKADRGIAFLEAHFPNDGLYGKLYKQISADKDYWKWWHLQYTNREAAFLMYSEALHDDQLPIEYAAEMNDLTKHPDTDNAFNNYTKSKRYGY